MKIFHNIQEAGEIHVPVLTIGTFDGVHVGHQKIIKMLQEKAGKVNGSTVIFTFHPHPRMVLYPDAHGVELIQTNEEKMQKLERYGVQNVILYPFSKDFSRLTATEFVRDILVNKLGVKEIVIGYDHQFGKNREGNITFLKELAEVYGFGVTEIGAEEVNAVNVSSTKIRRALQTGDVKTANEYLGEPFQINGTVVKGNGFGRKFGFPTANINTNSEVKLIPTDGIYQVKVYYNHTAYDGLLSIGTNPTIGQNNKRTIEVYILDFDKAIYDENLRLDILDFIRPQIIFDNIELLIEQMKKDELEVRARLD